MPPRHLVIHPDARLRVTCAPVVDFDGHLAALAQDMLETMYQAGGRGLAAPQVGMTPRLFVTDLSWKSGARSPRAYVNPVFLWRSPGRQVVTEACLSIPDQPRRLARPAEVLMAWQDLDGRAREERFLGVGAVIVQHEADHLDGVLILDHAEVPAPPDKPQ